MKNELMRHDGFKPDFCKIGMNDASSLLIIMPPKWLKRFVIAFFPM
jgi:hypothetical protein